MLRETWDGVLTGREPFIERMPAGQSPRFGTTSAATSRNPDERTAAKERILRIIEEYRDR